MNISKSSPEASPPACTGLLLRALSRRLTHGFIGVGILLLDVMTGSFLMFPILFVIPVSLSGWFCSRRFAISLAILLPLGRFLIAAFLEMRDPMIYLAADGLIRVAVLSFIAFLVSTARQTAALHERVRVLEGILPICGFCKAIRDEQGQWTQMEAYVTRRSEAQFSHSVCPKCMEIHYGDVLKPNRSA
jgi:hypothetical protein